MVTIEYERHSSNEESVVVGVCALLLFSVGYIRIKEGHVVIDWAQEYGKWARPSMCPGPNNLGDTVDYLLLAAVVGDLFR